MDESLNYKSENYKRKRIGKRKPDLVQKIVEKTGYQQSKVEKITDALFESIFEITQTGEPLFIQGFGSFRLRQLGDRVIEKHYISGEEAVSKAHWKLSFKDYNSLLESAGLGHRKRFNRRYGVWGDDAVELLDELVKRANETRLKRLKAEAEAKKQAKKEAAQSADN